MHCQEVGGEAIATFPLMGSNQVRTIVLTLEMPSVTTDTQVTLEVVATADNAHQGNASESTTVLAPSGGGPGDPPPGGAPLADTPWPMFHHDLRHTGRSSLNGPTTTPNLHWAYHAVTWPKSQPTIGTDGNILIGVGYNPLCVVDPVDGSEVFCTGPGGEGNTSSAAVDENGRMYIGARDNKIWAVNPDGTVAWTYKVNADGDTMSSPAILSDGSILVACGCVGTGRVFRLSADGVPLWEYAPSLSIRNSSPAVAADGTIYIGSVTGYLLAVKPDGTERWRARIGTRNRESSPSIGADGTVYIGSNFGLSAVSPAGAILWTFPTNGDVDTTAAIGATGNLHFSSQLRKTRTVYAITAAGNLVWSRSGGGLSAARFAQGPSPVIDAAGTIYAGIGPDLIAFNPNGTIRWQYLAADHILGISLGDGVIQFGARDNMLYQVGP
jgi:hypothetical protein